MILLDFSGTIHASIAVELRRNCGITTDIGYLRHLILSQVKVISRKFCKDYGELIICLDSTEGTWRRDIFEHYKSARRKNRKASDIDWLSIFEIVNTLIQEFKENVPYKFINVPKLEADDIIAILTEHSQELSKNLLGVEKVLIVSNDKDMRQLHHYPFVEQYLPRTCSIVKESDPDLYLTELILKGDVSDGIPNIRSDEDTFVCATKKQKAVSTKFIRSFLQEGENVLTPFEAKRLKRNRTLISFKEIPEEYHQIVLDVYNNTTKPQRMKLFQYLVSKGLNTLVESINDF